MIFYLQAFELVLEEIELAHVHAEFLLGVGRVVLPALGRDVVLSRHFLRRRRHGTVPLQKLRRLAEDDLRFFGRKKRQLILIGVEKVLSQESRGCRNQESGRGANSTPSERPKATTGSEL